MKRVILDTKMLLVPGSLGVNIPAELSRICDFQFKTCVLRANVNELEKLSKGHSKSAVNAKIGYKIALGLDIIEKEGYADDLLVEEAKDKDTIVATQDQNLKRRLKKQGSPHIILRQKRYLELIIP